MDKKEIKKTENYEKIEKDKIDLHNKMEKLKKSALVFQPKIID